MVTPSRPETEATPAPSRPWSGRVRLACLAIAAAVLAFYLWTARSPLTPYSFDVAKGQGYYNLLADGFISGHLSMNAEPDPELLKLKDPYDPAQVAPKLHDASLYHGKYYLYFGAVPAIVWFVPWKLICRSACPENLTVALFCWAGFLVWSALLLRVIRRHFPSAGGGMAVVAVLLAGLGSMCPVLLRRAAFWEVPIASVYLFNALCLWFVYLAFTAPQRRYLWLALASTSLGLAIGSRPGCVFLTAGLGLLALWFVRPTSSAERWFSLRSLGLLVAALAPVSACILGVLTYNYLRFANPFEFGTSYQLAGHNMHTWKMLDWANVPINTWHYFFSRAQLSVYFPFFEVIGNAPFKAPADYYGVENVYGVLPNLPVTILGLAALGVYFRRSLPGKTALAGLVSALLLAFALSLPVLLRYAAAASRYMVEIVPGLVALGFIGILVTEAALANRPRWSRGLFRVGWGALVVWTLLFNVFVSFQHNDLLRANNPASYARLARFFNRASPLLEKITGDGHGPLEFKLQLPKNRFGQLEPLVVTGLSFRADYIFLYYTDPRHLQVGFEHTGYGGGVSQPILVDYDQVQTIRIEMGSLYPPETHPFFAHQPVARILELKHRLKVWVNGVPYRDFNAEFYESSPKDVIVGRDPIYGAFGKKFTGTIVSQRRALDTLATTAGSTYGAVRLALQFPAERTGHFEPIVVTGQTGRGDILYVSYLDDKTIKFTIDHWGYSEAKTAAIPVNYEHIHLLEVDMGSMHPPPPGPVPPEGFLAPYSLKLDGDVILSGEMRFHPSAPEDIYYALNPIGGSTAGPNFSGRVIAKQLLDSPAK